MDQIIRLIAKFYQDIFGKRELLPIEKLCLDAWRQSLSGEVKNIIDKQLSHLKSIQRQAGGAKVCFYFNEGGQFPHFSRVDPNLHVATVTLEDGVESSSSMEVRIFVHRGRLFSVEFPKRPQRYLEQHMMSDSMLRVGSVSLKCDLRGVTVV